MSLLDGAVVSGFLLDTSRVGLGVLACSRNPLDPQPREPYYPRMLTELRWARPVYTVSRWPNFLRFQLFVVLVPNRSWGGLGSFSSHVHFL